MTKTLLNHTRNKTGNSSAELNNRKGFFKSIILSICIFLGISGGAWGQNISTYSFAQSTGSYTAITGGTTAIAASVDDGVGALINIGFNFTYHGVVFTQFAAGSNGYIQLGAATNTTIPSGSANMIMFMGGDGATGGTAPTYLLSGTSPNRVLTIQFPTHWVYYSVSSDLIAAQIKLYETTNVVQIIYGSSARLYPYNRSVGLVGGATTDYSTRVTSFASSTAGTSAAVTMPWSTTVFPSSGLTYTWTPPVVSACSGTPSTGSATITSTTGCPSTNFTLNSSGLSTGTGISYLWESSPNNSTWTSTGISTASYTTSTATTMYYRLKTTCSGSGLSNTTNAVSYTVAGNPCQCSAYIANYASSTADEEITNVTVGSMNNSSSCSVVATGSGSVLNRYGNYAGVVSGPSAQQSSSINFSLTQTSCGGAYSNYFQIYVDWNQDGDWLDAGEQVYSQGTSISGNQTVTGSFTVPITATVGTTRMRIINAELIAGTGNYAHTAYTYGETEDYCFTVTAATPCSGTPAPGNTVTSSASVTSGSTVNLSLSTPPTGTGLSYQWQSAPTSTGTWTNIGTSAATYTATVSATTWYRCLVTCSGATGTSAAVQVSLDYCLPPANTYACGTLNFVSFSTANGISNISNPTTCTGQYTNYSTTLSASQYASSSITCNFGATGSGTAYAVFIDWNNDLDFADAGELVLSIANSTGSAAAQTANFTVPSGTAVGNYRMRIRGQYYYTGIPSNPCALLSWGETEDYTFSVVFNPPCSGTPAPGNTVTSSASVTSGSTVNLSLSTPPTGTGLTYQWQSAPTSTGSWTNIGTSAATYTATVSATTWYRCIVTCSGTTGTSNAVQVTLTACVPATTYGCTDGDVIARVMLNTLDNNSGTGCPSGTAGYSNYTSNASLTTTLLPSSTYNCTVYAGQYPEGYAAWIDYNDDLVFDNSTERIGYSNGQVAGSGSVGVLGSSAVFPITLACTPPAGNHLLRVRAMYNTNGIDVTPCTANYYGETEDYMITISAAPACPSPGLMSSITTTANTALLTWATNCSSSSNYDFQYGSTGFTLGTGTILSNQAVTISAPNASFNLTGLNSGTTYDVYFRANCGNGVTSSWSLASAFTTINTASAASSSPTLCINTALTAITHTTTGATGIGTATGLPAGVTAAWASNTITISGTPSASGTFSYSIPLTGGYGTVNATGTIIVTPANTVGTASSSPTLCTNTPLTNITHATTGATGIGTATGLPSGITASWASNSITISGTPSASGTFSYSIPLSGGCGSVNATGTIIVNALPTVTATASQSICPGSSVTLSGGGANTYAWNNGITNGVAFTPSATTTYTVTGTASNGCVNTASSTVTLYALPTWGNLQWPASGNICAGGSFDIYGQVYENGVTNASYTSPGAGVVAQFGYSTSNSNPNTWTTWSNATYNTGVGNNDEFKGTLSGLSAGTYYYAFRYALNSGTCYVYGGYNVSGGGFWNGTSNLSGVLTVNALPTISGTANVCLGSSTALTGSGTAASSNAWSSSNTGVGTINSTTTTGTLSSVAAGTTNVTYTDNNGCVSTATTVTVNALPTVTATASAASLCAGSNLTLTGGGASTYTWDNGATNALAFAASTSTNYTVTGTDANGCVNTAATSVTVLASPSANAGADITGASTCGKNTVTVNATALNNNETGAWSVVTLGTGAILPGLFSAVTTPTDDFTGSYGGTYTLAWTVTNTSTNCTNTDNMLVTFNQPNTSSLGASIGNADFLWNGLTSVDWSTGGNWFRNVSGEYQLQTGTIEPTSTSQVFSLTAAQGGVCIGSNMPTIGNGDNALDVFVGSGITLNLASGSLNLSGNLVNNGTINAAQGTVNFIGSTNATISGSGTTTLNNVTINKSSGATLSLTKDLAINGQLDMTQGNVFTATSPNGLLTLGTSSAVPGTLTWTSGNIVGPFRRYFANSATSGNAGLFPVGTATYQRYAKVNFTASPGSNQTLTAWYKAGAPMSASIALYNGLPLTTQDGQLIQNYSADGYWQIDPTDNNYTAPINSANYSIELYANNLTGMQDPTICRIIKAAGSNTSSSNHVQWQGCGTHTTIPTGTSALAFAINSTSVGGFSWFGVGTSNNQALPVELTSFSGNCAAGKVVLEWSTATEHNSAYFQVEYSRDGAAWQNIGVVAAAGNSVQNINYTLTHEQVANGNNYYRLRQVDIDGVEKLYDIIAVTCAAGSDPYILTYPNPSEQNFQVEVLDENLIGTATLSMVDARGMLIHSELLEVKAGTNLFLFNNTGLAPGIYYVRISKGAYSSAVVKQVVR